MSSWIRADYYFDERSVLLLVGERDAREIGDLVREHQDSPNAMQFHLSQIINRCRPDLDGHILRFMSFCPQKRAWEMLVEHPSLPTMKMYEQASSQRLRLEDALPWDATTKVVAGVPLVAKTAKDIKEIVDTTLRNYIKDESTHKHFLPKKAMLADEPITVK